MKTRLTMFAFLIQILSLPIFSQVLFTPFPPNKIPPDYKYGLLTAKNFPYYKTLYNYNFAKQKIRVALFDDRFALNLQKIQCSDIVISNYSDYKDPELIYKVRNYIDSIFTEADIIIDSTSTNILEVRLEALDARVTEKERIRIHGLCQMKFIYNGLQQEYCIDIYDGNKHAPLRKGAFVTHGTGMRMMLSASIRECIERFLMGLNVETPYRVSLHGGPNILVIKNKPVIFDN